MSVTLLVPLILSLSAPPSTSQNSGACDTIERMTIEKLEGNFLLARVWFCGENGMEEDKAPRIRWSMVTRTGGDLDREAVAQEQSLVKFRGKGRAMACTTFIPNTCMQVDFP